MDRFSEQTSSITSTAVSGRPQRSCTAGSSRLGEYFYPTPRLLMPFVVLLSLYTGVNTGSLVESQRDDFWVASTLGHRRFYWKVWKERAKRWQTGSIACDEDVTHPARLVQFLIRLDRISSSAGSPLTQRAAVFIRSTEREKTTLVVSEQMGIVA